MMQYDVFYRRYGVRQPSQLQTPPMYPLAQITLPNMSAWHYLSNSAVNQGPDEKDVILREYTSPAVMEVVTDLKTIMGAPRRNVQPIPLIQHLFSHTRRFRKLGQLGAFENAGKTLVVFNYAMINAIYKYPRQTMSLYNRWYNIQTTLWSKVAEVAESSRREQFIIVDTPKMIPTVGACQIFERTGIQQSMLKILNTPEQFFLLEMWQWLGKSRTKSVIGRVPENKLHLVNLVFRESGRFTVVNLGVLNDWRKQTEDEALAEGEDATKHKGTTDAVQMQKRFLHFCMSLAATASMSGDAPEADEPDVGAMAEITRIQPNIDGGTITKTEIPVSEIDDGHDTPINGEKFPAMGIGLTEAQVKQIESDLAQLETIWLNVDAMRRSADKEAAALTDEHEPGYDDDELKDEVNPYGGPRTNQNGERIPDYITPAHEDAAEIIRTGELGIATHTDAPHDYSAGVKLFTERLASQGLMTAAEQRRYLEQSQKFKTLPAPNGVGTLETYAQINPEHLTIKESHSIPDISTVVDKSMLKSSLHQFDRQYLTNVLHKDIANAVLNMQNAGLCVTEFEVEHDDSLLGTSNNYMIRVNPVEGAPSTLRFKLPHVKEDGTYRANGVDYRLRKQMGDIPIQKTSPTRVTLTSYYGKVMVERSQKKVNDYGHWLRNQIMVAGLDVDNPAVSDIHPNDVFAPRVPVPKLYSDIAQGFASFTLASQSPVLAREHLKLHLNFDISKVSEIYDKEIVAKFEKDGYVICGSDEHYTQYLVMNAKNDMFLIGSKEIVPLPGIEELLGLDASAAPIDMVTVSIMGRALPLGLVLGYYFGLEKLIHAIKARYRIVLAGKRLNLAPTEYAIRFEDETLVLDRRDRFATLAMAGMNEYANVLRHYSIYDFNRRGVYLNVMESKGSSVRWVREMDHLERLFIDPITRELLVEMQEPTSFAGLLLRANEMLMTNTHPRERQRIKGYERYSGEVYRELVNAVRAHSNKPSKAKLPIDLHPYQVWKNISEDPSKAQVVDTNPIENLKEMEAVTYGGHGGRNSRTMTKATRAFKEEDKGTIGESTVDSGDVGINIYTSADPHFTTVRGMSRAYVKGESGTASLFSTSALNAVGADRDDPKRVNFIGIQNAHMLSCNGYHIAPVRTGYEQVIPHRTGDMYATTAKQEGEVVSADEHGMVVKYKDGTTQAIELGRRYGAAAGLTVPHDLVLARGLKAGKKFGVGQPLAYNKGFFDYDPLNPDQIAMKSGVMVKVALMESPLTLEDSCLITRRVANLLKTQITKPRTIVVDFKQGVSRLVAPGTTLGSEDILCVIEDAITGGQSLFDTTSLDTLRALSAQTPVAKSAGVVERIELYYNGEKEDMSESLRAIANTTDRMLAKRMQAVGKKPKTGKVDEGFRDEGEPLLSNTAAIRIYITREVPATSGDKGVFANQLKTVFGEVTDHDIRTESGVRVDALFGAVSIDARIVNSPDIIGTTMTLLRLASKRAVKAYRS